MANITFTDSPVPVVKTDPNTRERTWFTLTDFEKKFWEVSIDEFADLTKAANYLDIPVISSD